MAAWRPPQPSRNRAPLRRIIQFAYDIDPVLHDPLPIGGPSWIDDELFVIEARGPADLSLAEARRMMQSLLRERFNLRARIEKRELPVYALVQARANGTLGPGLRRSKIDCAAYSEALWNDRARTNGMNGRQTETGHVMSQAAALVCVLGLTCCAAQAQSLSPANASGQVPAESQKQSFGIFVRDLGRNFRALPSLQTAVVLAIGGGLAAAVHGEDAETTARWANSRVLDGVFETGAALGGGWVQLGGAVGTYALGGAVRSPRAALLGADLMRGQIVNAVLTEGIKRTVDRQRPDGGHFSFPSGHTSSTFTTAAVLEGHFGWKIGVPAYATAAFVGGSRLQENQHYLSDVVFGAAIGIVSGRTTSLGHGSARFVMSPLVAPAALGLTFTHVPHMNAR